MTGEVRGRGVGNERCGEGDGEKGEEDDCGWVHFDWIVLLLLRFGELMMGM